MSVRHTKILRDLLVNKSRSLLVILAVAVGVAAFGLFRRKAWARNAAVVALGFTVLISLISLSNGFTNIRVTFVVKGDAPVLSGPPGEVTCSWPASM